MWEAAFRRAQEVITELIKAILVIFPCQIDWKAIQWYMQKRDEPVFDFFFNQFKKTFRQNSGIKDLNDDNAKLSNSFFLSGLNETFSTLVKQINQYSS